MDKVIDGVDVSECKFCMYKGFKAFPQCKLNIDSFATACVQHKDCHYKQLMRARAEYDDLHLTYAGCKTANNGLQELNRKLEQENKKLKSDFDKCMDANKYHFDKWCKCEQALKEIKEIASEPCIPDEKCSTCKSSCMQKDILAKINEVIGAEK